MTIKERLDAATRISKEVIERLDGRYDLMPVEFAPLRASVEDIACAVAELAIALEELHRQATDKAIEIARRFAQNE